MSHLPAWAIDGLREAGLSAEGWNGRERSCFYTITGIGRVGVNERAELTLECDQSEVPDAFRLAARLAAALENNPDPRVAELERENEGLRERCKRLSDGVALALDTIEILCGQVEMGPFKPLMDKRIAEARAALSEATNE